MTAQKPRTPLDVCSAHPGVSPHGHGPFDSRRSTVMGKRGMVASSQPLATAAGIEVLNKGGNAADAAIAVGATLNVTEPGQTGIGGDAFCLFWDAKTRTVRGLNGSGRSPQKLTLDKLESTGKSSLNLHSALAVTVPGTAAAWVDTHGHFGSKRLSLQEVLAPAIRLAEEGYPVHEISASAWRRSEELLKRASPNGNEMLLPTGKAPRAGDIMQMPNLAQTFRSLAEHGKDGFYKGRIAKEIVRACQEAGGVLDEADLLHHGQVGSELIEPIAYEYGATSAGAGDGITLHECPPNGQGLVALIALGILDALQNSGAVQDLMRYEHNSPEYLHALIEALRFGFADGDQYIADASHGGADHVRGLLNRTYLSDRAKAFDAEKAVHIAHGQPGFSSDTVYLTCTDADGSACSFIQSNYAGFGTGIVPKGCGFTLANRCATFNFRQGSLNCLGPRKRPYNTIIPAMATKRGADGRRELFMSYGVMGGYMQPQGHVQVLLNVLRGFAAQAAIDAPRFCIGAGTPDQGPMDSTVYCERGIPQETIDALCRKGHQVTAAHSWHERTVFGRGQVIMRVESDAADAQGKSWLWAAGSDPRGDGCAFAQI